LIIDCYGLLSSIYRYGEISYIGGGFGVGIHNVLEAAVYGIPVIFGPNNKKFREAQHLLANKGGFEIHGYDDFEQLMNKFLTDEAYLKQSGKAAGDYVKGNAGAMELILKNITL
jgi:3-deoxy-D-manno-octulosonic-acid transferase